MNLKEILEGRRHVVIRTLGGRMQAKCAENSSSFSSSCDRALQGHNYMVNVLSQKMSTKTTVCSVDLIMNFRSPLSKEGSRLLLAHLYFIILRVHHGIVRLPRVLDSPGDLLGRGLEP